MKTLKKLILPFFIFSCLVAHSQARITSFSEDSVKFLDELATYMQTGLATHKGVKEFITAFSQTWKSPAYTPAYKKATYAICNNMLTRRVQVYPVFQAFLNSMVGFVNGGFTQTQFNQWDSCLKKLMAERHLSDFGNFLSMSENLFGSNTLFKSPTISWVTNSKSYSFNCDSMPIIVFKNLNLKCVNQRNDSLVIYHTQGTYFPLTGTWVGQGGRTDWSRTGLSADSVYANLRNYHITCKRGGFGADSVTFWNKSYFKSPLLGEILERNISEPKGKETFPRFISYGKRFKIPNLAPGITYDGGFSMKGRRFVGAGTNEQPAELIFHREHKPILVVSSVEYSITKNRIMAEDAQVTIHIDTDSIYHPDVQMVYLINKKYLSLIRSDQGLSQSPFFDNYHRVNMFFEDLSWYTDQPKMEFHNLQGSAQNIADFESQDFFRPAVYDAFSPSGGTNALSAMANYSHTVNSRNFRLDDYASYLHLISTVVRPAVMKMASIGLIMFNTQTDMIHVEDKLFKYVLDESRKSDYDIIDFHSVNPPQDNGVMDLLTYNITLYGIKDIILSDSQNVYVFPKNEEVVLHKNRNITFAGNVHAGRFDFYGKHFTFNYTDFKIKLANTDSVRILAESFKKDAQGRRRLVPVKSVIQDLNGELAIDRPNNKSGMKELHNYPILKSDTCSFVYYNKKNIQHGVYHKDKFYFKVNPFTIDSLERFTNAGLHFGGTFASAGIVPNMKETLRLQPDYSLGFVHNAPPEGLALYGGKAKFHNQLHLSNQGLKGDGSINYVTSVSKSTDFTLFPDSVNALVSSFVVKEQKTPPEFPQVRGDSVYEHWITDKNYMSVADIKKPFECYNGISKFHGKLGLTPKLLVGGGEVDFQRASLISKLIKFKQHKFMADTADFYLKQSDSTGIAFNTKNMNSTVDFDKKMGEFVSNGSGSVVGFPVNKYIAYMDEFKWYMDQDVLELSAKKSQTVTSNAKQLQFSGSRFISTAPKQDSLQFIAPSARYDLRNYLITARQVPFINVADARIIPDSGKVYIHKNAFMEPLIKAKIIANTVTKYYTVYNADISITSRKNYSGSGYYNYVDEMKNKRPIYFSNIRVDTTYQTVASTTVSDTANFELSPNFKFKGKVNLISKDPFLFFDGECRIKHDCNEIKIAWTKFASQIDPNNIAIPVTANPVGENKVPLAASPVLSTTDSIYIYPAFLSPVIYPKKDVVLSADSGYLVYNKSSGQYRISNKEKLVEQSLPGNYISLDTRRCILYNEGKINLGPDYGPLDLQTIGNMTDYIIPDSVKANVMMLLNFFFDNDALNTMGTDISNFANLKPFDYSKTDYQKDLRELMGKDAADKLITQLTLYGTMKKLPKELQSSITISRLTFKWNSSTGSYISQGPIALGSVGKVILNKLVTGVVEVKKRRSGDELNMYIELDPMHWYFFTYSNGYMAAVSSNADFNNAISGIKPDKRAEKTDKGKISFGPAQPVQKTIFLRHVEGGSDNN